MDRATSSRGRAQHDRCPRQDNLLPSSQKHAEIPRPEAFEDRDLVLLALIPGSLDHVRLVWSARVAAQKSVLMPLPSRPPGHLLDASGRVARVGDTNRVFSVEVATIFSLDNDEMQA